MTKEDPRLIVTMREDYTTESLNLGRRTYKGGCSYQVCPAMLAELTGAGAADEIKQGKPYPRTAIIREQVKVIPNVTRWISANGVDRHDLVKGRPVRLPSNLAVYLTECGMAVAA